MISDDLIDVPVEVFGGYCPAIVPANLPPGAANIAQDVAFPQAGVRTRGGLGNGVAFAGAAIPAGASINGLKTYLTPSGGQRLMIWDSLGDLFKENPQGTLSLINSRPYQNLFCESQTLFGREYQAFFNSLGGADIPRQFDDTNWDRVSQVGPGVAPTAGSFTPAPATIQGAAGAPINISTVVWGGQFIGQPPHITSYYAYFTVTTAAAHGLVAGQRVTLAGSNATPSVNGTQTVNAVPSPTTFTVLDTVLFSSAANGTAAGTVTASTASLSRVAGVVLASTSAAHGFQAGWQVLISGVPNTNIGGGISAIARDGTGTVTVTTAAAHGLVVNSKIAINGVTNPDATFNGTFPVAAVLSPTQFTYLQSGTVAASGAGTGNVQDIWDTLAVIASVPSTTTFTYNQTGANDTTTSTGTATIVPQVMSGLHQVSVAFITRQGYITKPAPPVAFNATDAGLISLSQIATGPSNIVGRLLLFTPVISPPATTGSFYSITSAGLGGPAMIINDNTTTGFVADFNEAILIASFAANYLFNQLELGESAFFLPYNSRTVWLGERNKVSNFDNLTFDGGFQGSLPNGWTPDPNNNAGGGSALAQPAPTDWGDAYLIQGDGATAIRGKITQPAYQDSLGVAIIQANTSYSVRVRLAASAGFSQGTLHINLSSVSGAFTTVGLAVPAASLPVGIYKEFIAALTDVPLANLPSDLVLQVYMDGTPNNGAFVVVDSIEPFPTLTPFNSSLARISRAFNPESFDSITGQVQIRAGDGQQLRAGFPLRNSLYLAKDHYLGYVTDDGVNEPALWAFTEVSATVGICGPNAVDWNEEWAVFAERSGVYLCWGSDPAKITPEIQSDASGAGRTSWASINWAFASTIWVRIDKVNKMILIGAPINGATTPNVVFMMDYRWLDNAEDIAASPLVTYSSFTGKILAHGRGRRWAIWNIAANSMTFAERADGTAQPFFGGVGNGTVFWQQDISIQGFDHGAAVNGIYQSYPLPSSMEEQQYQLRAHRKLFGYLKFRAFGSGTLNLAVGTVQRSTLLRGYPLSANPVGDGERPLNIHGERFFLTVSTNAVNSWFQLEKWIACIKKDSSALVRGVSS
jgi:hypothetical protein